MQAQGIPFDQYLKYTGMNIDMIKEQMKPQAVKRIETRLVLEAVAAAENIVTSDEEMEEELKKMSESYKMEVEKIKEYMGERELGHLKEDLAVQKAVDFLVAEAKLV